MSSHTSRSSPTTSPCWSSLASPLALTRSSRASATSGGISSAAPLSTSSARMPVLQPTSSVSCKPPLSSNPSKPQSTTSACSTHTTPGSTFPQSLSIADGACPSSAASHPLATASWSSGVGTPPPRKRSALIRLRLYLQLLDMRARANMPTSRSFFACAAVGNYVFVAGGHDNTKMALASAEHYDLKTDSWEVLPLVHELCDECMGAVLDDKIHAIRGYHIATQCKYVKSAEIYDPGSRAWLRIEETINVSHGAIVGALGCLFAIHNREILACCSRGNKWEVLDELPEGDDGISPPLYVTSYGRKLVVTGTSNVDEEKYRTILYNLSE